MVVQGQKEKSTFHTKLLPLGKGNRKKDPQRPREVTGSLAFLGMTLEREERV